MPVIVRQRKPPTFRGLHNATKVKCLLALEDYKLGRNRKGLTAYQLHQITGCPYRSILASMPKWIRWGIVNRHTARNHTNYIVYHYKISVKGRKWLERHAWRMPLERYFNEMREFQERRKGTIAGI